MTITFLNRAKHAQKLIRRKANEYHQAHLELRLLTYESRDDNQKAAAITRIIHFKKVRRFYSKMNLIYGRKEHKNLAML